MILITVLLLLAIINFGLGLMIVSPLARASKGLPAALDEITEPGDREVPNVSFT